MDTSFLSPLKAFGACRPIDPAGSWSAGLQRAAEPQWVALVSAVLLVCYVTWLEEKMDFFGSLS